MRIEVWYEAPDADVIELNDEQEKLWLDYSETLNKARETQREQGWNVAMPLYDKADELYEELIEALYLNLSHDLPIEDIQEW